MTDHKSWLWRKKPSEKTTIVADKVDLTSREHEEEIHVLLAEKAELERNLADISGKLATSIAECNAKDDIIKKNAKTAQEALAGWEKAEAKALSLKQELDESLKQRETSEERTHYLDGALKECMQQLRFVREDQEQRIHDVLLKSSTELEETKMFLEEKLAESGKKIAKLTSESSQLNNVLLLKDQLIEDLSQQRAKAESNVHVLLARLEAMDKDNNSLRYEVRVLEKEVDIRNEEREFNRRTADAAHKHHLENVKKIAKLESECQRLRVLVRKRLPGPAAVAKMKSEVNILQRDYVGNRRKNSNSNASNLQFEYVEDGYAQSPSKKTNLLMEKIRTLEEENVALRETLQKKVNELQISRNMYVQTASKLSQVEAHVEESPKGQIGDNRSSTLYDVSLASMSDVGSDDKVSCAGSWASALISELEQFRDGKDKDKAALPSKSVRESDMNHLMDDFAEMEKLALVCVDKPTEKISVATSGTNENSLSDTTGKELVPVPSMPSKLSISISKLVEIIRGINLPSQDDGVLQTLSGKNGSYYTDKDLQTSTGYLVRVFQWKTSELATILQNFLHTCDELLYEKADLEKFTQELTSALEWIINHCFSLQDVASMKDAIRKQFECDETRSESETEAGLCGIVHFGEAGNSAVPKELLLSSPLNAPSCYQNETYHDMSETGGKLTDLGRTMDSVKQDLELQSASNDCKSLRNQLQESESAISSLQADVEALKQSKAMIEDQFENHKMTIEDLNSQLSAVRSELDETCLKVTSLEAELKNKVDHCENLEATCLDFQLQLESLNSKMLNFRVTKMDTAEHVNEGEKQLRTEWEISAASEKLVECQQTILHLGKQLKALASPQDAEVSDKFISTPTTANSGNTRTTTTNPTLISEKKLTSQHSSLLDQMQAEDEAETEQLESPQTKEIICAKDFSPQPAKKHITESIVKTGNEIDVASLAVVPSKKQQTTSAGFFKKLLRRKKKSSSKKIPLPLAAYA